MITLVEYCFAVEELTELIHNVKNLSCELALTKSEINDKNLRELVWSYCSEDYTKPIEKIISGNCSLQEQLDFDIRLSIKTIQAHKAMFKALISFGFQRDIPKTLFGKFIKKDKYGITSYFQEISPGLEFCYDENDFLFMIYNNEKSFIWDYSKLDNLKEPIML